MRDSKATIGSGKRTIGERSAGVPPAVFPKFSGNIKIRTRGHLPHWEGGHAAYFVTFRLADSLPKQVLERVRFARSDIPETAAVMRRPLSDAERLRLRKLHSRRMEAYLDAGAGACHLRNPAVARMVALSLKKFDGERIRLFAWCIMPNHVHVLFQDLRGDSLKGILHSWKSFTAKQANRILARSGEFWQREYYDHLIRNGSEFARAVSYIIANPKRARLRNWPWVWAVPEGPPHASI